MSVSRNTSDWMAYKAFVWVWALAIFAPLFAEGAWLVGIFHNLGVLREPSFAKKFWIVLLFLWVLTGVGFKFVKYLQARVSPPNNAKVKKEWLIHLLLGVIVFLDLAQGVAQLLSVPPQATQVIEARVVDLNLRPDRRSPCVREIRVDYDPGVLSTICLSAAEKLSVGSPVTLQGRWYWNLWFVVDQVAAKESGS